ncbi:MAG: hypothetical protein HKO55_02045 [Gammaproteobacteria bacterium]|nr:hypothetical protein [Gammaproteobacteria bacterium]
METVLSLAVAAKGECDPRPFIDALEESGIFAAENIEIHIASDLPLPANSLAPAANVFVHQCASGTSILKLWGMALAQTASSYVAVLDINCPPAAEWFSSAMSEIAKGGRLFFGPVNSAWKSNDRRIVGYIAEYAQFSGPLALELDEVPGNNLVFHGSLLGDREALTGQGFFKTFMIWRLATEGHLVPARLDEMVVMYRKPFRVRHYVRRRFVHGRCFGATRHDNAGQPPRLLCLGFTLVLPLVRTSRIYKAVRKHAELRRAFWRFFILIFASESAWSAGEFFGYAFGGRSCCEKLD